MNPYIGTTKKKRSQGTKLWARWFKGNVKRNAEIRATVRGLLSYQISKPKSPAVPRAAGDASSQVLTRLPQAEPRQFWQSQRF